jgi:hypothetical protein
MTNKDKQKGVVMPTAPNRDVVKPANKSADHSRRTKWLQTL